MPYFFLPKNLTHLQCDYKNGIALFEIFCDTFFLQQPENKGYIMNWKRRESKKMYDVYSESLE